MAATMVLVLHGNSEIGNFLRKEKSLLFDLYKAFDKIESSHKSDSLIRKYLFSFMRAPK